jgi:hypothetical protein
MKTAQYTHQEVQIAAGDSVPARRRWLYGLRLLADPDAFNAGSSQLRPGVMETLTTAAAKRDIKLSEREIQYRLRCARAYPTEAEFRTAVRNFPTWNQLRDAGFPPYQAPLGEPPADWRTDAERAHDRNRAYLDATNGMDAMFPLRDFEPVETTLEDLETFMKDSQAVHDDIVAGFEATHARRRTYLNRLIDAVGGDMSATWEQAESRLGGA